MDACTRTASADSPRRRAGAREPRSRRDPGPSPAGVAWLLLAALAVPPAALTEPANHDEVPAHWLGGSITSNRTLTAAAPGPEYVVYGDVIVEPGVTLTVEPGVTLAFIDDSDFFTGGSYFGLSELIVRGTLAAAGTAVDSIVFRSQSGTPDHWGEIRVEAGQASLSYVQVRDGTRGLVVHPGAGATMTNATVRAKVRGVESYGSLVVGSSRISAGTGIQADYGGAQITDTEVHDSGTGMWLAQAQVKGCLIRNVANVGIVIGGANVSFLPDDSTHAVPTEIRQCEYGVSIDYYLGAEGPIELRNLLVRDCTLNGINVFRVDGVTVNYCTVVNCATGIRSDIPPDPTRVLNSIVASNGTQLQISSGFVNYTDLWGPLGTFSGSYGSEVAVFDPGFVQPGVDYHLAPTSLFTDYSVSGGQIGAYGPGVPGSPSTTDVPPTSALGALRVRPNPSRDGRLSVQFGAASGGTAQLRVLDLAGRVLRSRAVDVSPGPAGLFDVTQDPLPSGMYFIQVVLGGRTSFARASVVR